MRRCEVLFEQRRKTMEFDELSNKVIGCAIEVHKQLGPGLLESAYERCLSYELICAGLRHVSQTELPIDYKGTKLDCAYRVDLLIEDKLISKKPRHKLIVCDNRLLRLQFVSSR